MIMKIRSKYIRLSLIHILSGYARKIASSPYGFRAFAGADVEDVCEDDSASADTGDRDV